MDEKRRDWGPKRLNELFQSTAEVLHYNQHGLTATVARSHDSAAVRNSLAAIPRFGTTQNVALEDFARSGSPPSKPQRGAHEAKRKWATLDSFATCVERIEQLGTGSFVLSLSIAQWERDTLPDLRKRENDAAYQQLLDQINQLCQQSPVGLGPNGFYQFEANRKFVLQIPSLPGGSFTGDGLTPVAGFDRFTVVLPPYKEFSDWWHMLVTDGRIRDAHRQAPPILLTPRIDPIVYPLLFDGKAVDFTEVERKREIHDDLVRLIVSKQGLVGAPDLSELLTMHGIVPQAKSRGPFLRDESWLAEVASKGKKDGNVESGTSSGKGKAKGAKPKKRQKNDDRWQLNSKGIQIKARLEDNGTIKFAMPAPSAGLRAYGPYKAGRHLRIGCLGYKKTFGLTDEELEGDFTEVRARVNQLCDIRNQAGHCCRDYCGLYQKATVTGHPADLFQSPIDPTETVCGECFELELLCDSLGWSKSDTVAAIRYEYSLGGLIPNEVTPLRHRISFALLCGLGCPSQRYGGRNHKFIDSKHLHSYSGCCTSCASKFIAEPHNKQLYVAAQISNEHDRQNGTSFNRSVMPRVPTDSTFAKMRSVKCASKGCESVCMVEKYPSARLLVKNDKIVCRKCFFESCPDPIGSGRGQVQNLSIAFSEAREIVVKLEQDPTAPKLCEIALAFRGRGVHPHALVTDLEKVIEAGLLNPAAVRRFDALLKELVIE